MWQIGQFLDAKWFRCQNPCRVSFVSLVSIAPTVVRRFSVVVQHVVAFVRSPVPVLYSISELAVKFNSSQCMSGSLSFGGYRLWLSQRTQLLRSACCDERGPKDSRSDKGWHVSGNSQNSAPAGRGLMDKMSVQVM